MKNFNVESGCWNLLTYSSKLPQIGQETNILFCKIPVGLTGTLDLIVITLNELNSFHIPVDFIAAVKYIQLHKLCVLVYSLRN